MLIETALGMANVETIAQSSKRLEAMEAMAEAAKAGKGSVSLDGKMVDIASIRMAEALLKKAGLVA